MKFIIADENKDLVKALSGELRILFPDAEIARQSASASCGST